jgi:quinoprotein glucose dehydrogenase
MNPAGLPHPRRTTLPLGAGYRFHAYDKASGKVVWETEFLAGTGAPVTYNHQGKQYIVVAIGGRRHAAELVALSVTLDGF